VIVVDLHAVPSGGAVAGASSHKWVPASGKPLKREWAPEVLVRKLALSAEPSEAVVLLLTDSTRPRAVPWPTALRLELERPNRAELTVRVAKDRRGRSSLAKTLPFSPIVRAVG